MGEYDKLKNEKLKQCAEHKECVGIAMRSYKYPYKDTDEFKHFACPFKATRIDAYNRETWEVIIMKHPTPMSTPALTGAPSPSPTPMPTQTPAPTEAPSPH